MATSPTCPSSPSPTRSTLPTASHRPVGSGSLTTNVPRWRRPSVRNGAVNAPSTGPAGQRTPTSTECQAAAGPRRTSRSGRAPRAASRGSRRCPGGEHSRHPKAGIPTRLLCRPATDSTGPSSPRRQRPWPRRKTTAPAASPHRRITDHGANLTVEDCDIRTWYRLWGKALQATTPGRLITAISRECEKTGGRLLRASTSTTKLSQTCLCGAQVTKALADRVHRCTLCGLIADRDMVSAALAAHVRLTNPDDPKTRGPGQSPGPHDTHLVRRRAARSPVESTAARCTPPQGPHPRGSPTPIPGPRASARQNTTDRYRPTPNEPRPARMRHKVHVGTATPIGNAPPTDGAPEQELIGRHPITG